jgi:F-type H+-transporting ATPase subunit epsilon
MRLRAGGEWVSIALLGGFAEVEADDVTVLVNGAELGSMIDAAAAQAAFETAQQAAKAYEGQSPSTEKIKAAQDLARTRAWLQASKAN